MSAHASTPLEPIPDAGRVELGGRTGAARDCALLILLFAVFLLLRPMQNAPLIDDGAFAWSVQWLIEHGQFRILEYSHINPFQVFWGWLFCLPGGFSFTALRWSNWVLGASTLCSTYLLLRELGSSRKLALAGAATLGISPIFVILSCSFMTDVPLVAMAMWATYSLVRAVRQRSDRWLWVSAAFSAMACAVRIPGAVLPVATGCVLLLHTGRWGRRPDRLLAALLPLAFLALLILSQPAITHVTIDTSSMANSVAGRLYLLKYAIGILPQMMVSSLILIAAMGGLCLLPLALGGSNGRAMPRAGIILLALVILGIIAAWLGQRLFHPLSPGQTWELEELGATSDLVAGRVRPVYPKTAMYTILFGGLAAGSLILAYAFWRRARAVAGESVLRWQVFGHLLLIALLWLTYDRYVLPILPLLIVLAVIGMQRIRWAPFACGAVLLLGISMAGLRDHLAYNRALWGSIDALRGQGIPVSAIDAGYSANLWLHYAHPEDAPHDAAGKAFVPYMTSHSSLQYRIANSPMSGYEILRIVPVSKWMGRDTLLYVLQRIPGAQIDEPAKGVEKW